MADTSRNPQDQASLARQLATMRTVQERLEAALARQEEILAQTAQVEARLEGIEAKAAARESSAAGKLPPAGGRLGVAEEAKAASSVDKRALAEERSTKAVGERVRLQQQEQRLLPPASFTPLGPATPSAGLHYGPEGGIISDREAALNRAAARRQRELGLLQEAQSGGGLRGRLEGQVTDPGLEKVAPQAQAAGRGMEFYSRTVGQNSNVIARNGALTTEFFTAAAKGQVTIRELGQQVGLTIAKFGGWTTAAAAVYGVLGAVRELGSGALEAQSGVQSLGRFLDQKDIDPSKATQGFVDASRQVNVSIKDVADTQAGFLRVYRNQDDSLAATRVSLKATKLDNISAADSVRYFTAIAQEFQLPVGKLPQLLDQVAAGYRIVGANAAETVPALARSAAAVKNSGGDLTELTQIIVAMRRLTGVTGNVIGTAVARSAANFVVKPSSIKVFREFGLDEKEATSNYTQFLLDAVTRSKTLSGQDIRKLAAAIGGPQFGARLFGALLADRGDIVEKAGAAVAPGAAKGTADLELKHVLQRADEQISALGNNLQRLGAVLAQSGALDSVLGIVKALNFGLDTTTRLIDVFGRLAGPLAHPLAILGEMYGLLRLMQRFDVGRFIPVGAQGQGQGLANAFRRPQDARRAAEVSQSLGYQTEAVRNEVVASATAANAATTRLKVAMASEERIRNAEASTEEEIAAAAARTTKAREGLLAADQRVTIALEEQAATATADAEFVAARKRGLSTDAAAAAAGLGLKSPSLGQGGAPAPIVPIGPLTAEEAAAVEAGAAARPVAKQAGRGRRAYDALRNDLAANNREIAKMGPTGERVAAELATVGGAVEGAGSAVGRMAGGLKGLAGKLLALRVGPFGALLIALAAYEGVSHVIDQLNEYEKQVYGAFDKAKLTGDPEKIRAAAKKIGKPRGGYQGVLDDLGDSYADAHNFFNDIPVIGFGGHLTSKEAARRRDSKDDQRFVDQLEAANLQGLNLSAQQIRGNLSDRLKGAKGADQELRVIERAFTEASHAQIDSDPKIAAKQKEDLARLAADLKQRLADVQTRRKDINAALDALDSVDAVTTFTDTTAAKEKLYGPTKENINRAALGVAAARQNLAGQPTLDDMKKLAQALGNADQTVQDIEKQAQQVVSEATTPAEAGRAREQAIAAVRKVYIGDEQKRIDGLTKRRKNRAKQINDLQAELDKSPYGGGAISPLGSPGGDLTPGLGPGLVEGALRADLRAKQQKLAALRRQQKADNDAIAQAEIGIKIEGKLVEAYAHEQRKAQFTDTLQAFDTHTTLLTSVQADPLANARTVAARLGQKTALIRQAMAKHLATEADLEAAIAAANQADQQIAQAEIARFEAQQTLSSSQFALGTFDQGAILQHAISAAQQTVGVIQSKGSRVDPTTLLSAQNAVVQAQIAYRDYLRQQARDMVEASAELAKSKTEDPVKQSRIDLTTAEKLLRFATTPVERIKALADVNNKRRTLRQTIQKERFDQIEFDADIENISKETELSRLQSLLKTIKGNRDLKREIQRRIHSLKADLENSGNLELAIGSVRIPTAYEIRRALIGGVAPQRQVQVHQANHFNVTAAAGREHLAGEAIAAALGTSTAGALRSVTPGSL